MLVWSLGVIAVEFGVVMVLKADVWKLVLSKLPETFVCSRNVCRFMSVKTINSAKLLLFSTPLPSVSVDGTVAATVDPSSK